MAGENLDIPSFGNFGIENTMEFGPGSQELLNDLMAPETSTSDPNQLQKIGKEVTPPNPAAPKPSTPPAPPAPAKETGEKVVEEDASQKALIAALFENEGDEEDDDDAADAPIDDESGNPSETPAEEDSDFAALSRDLFKLGVFVKDEDEDDDNIKITTPQEFLERFQLEKKKGADQILTNFLSQFGEDYQEAFKAIYVKGVDPKEYFGIYNNIVNFAELDLTDENNQVAVIKQALVDQGFEAEDITSEIERLKNYGDLEQVATKHHKVLMRKEAQKLKEAEQRAEIDQQQKAAYKRQYIQNVQGVLQEKIKEKEFDGIPINPKLANELQDFLLVDKYKTVSGETLTDFDRAILELKRPENHAKKVKLALLMKLMEKDPNLSTIQRAGATKKNEKLFGEMAKYKKPQESSSSGQRRSYFDGL